LEASLRVAAVERQQLQLRLQELGDDAASEARAAALGSDELRARLAARDAAARRALEESVGLQQQVADLQQQVGVLTAAKVRSA
jgi:hypothetical protein